MKTNPTPTNLQREKIHRKDCDMLSNVGIPSAQKDESYCTCVNTPTHPPTETVSDCYRVSERPYTDKLNAQEVRIRTYNYPGGREALIQRAVNWRGFTREEAEKQYPEEIL